MKTKLEQFSRRRFLRGTLLGAGVTVGLPMLDCLLNDNGTAYAAELGGGPLPSVFGTWFWPLGLCPTRWEPEKAGADFKFGPAMQALEPIRDKINLFSGLQTFLDGKPNNPHETAVGVTMTGRALDMRQSGYARSLDEVIAAHLNARTRFPSLTVACDGFKSSTWSARGPGAMNPAEISPLNLYRKIFGPGFADPNSSEFKPDPRVLARRSVLSAVAEERQALMKLVGVRDKERLDSMFTSLRDLEQRLVLESSPPPPMAACKLPPPPEGERPGLIIDDAMRSHRLFITLLSHALACGQTRIFNVVVATGLTQIQTPGDTSGYHMYSHEEPVDPVLGYQPKCDWFSRQFMAALVEMVQILDSYREGAGSLLDRSLILGYTDHGEARLHSLKNLMAFTIGRAGGRIKTGMHIAATGDSSVRVGLTCQRAMGVMAKSWGTGSNEVSEPYSELLVTPA